MNEDFNLIAQILNSERAAVMTGWLEEVRATANLGPSSKTLSADTEKIMTGLEAGLRTVQQSLNLDDPAWAPLMESLEDISRSGAAQGTTAAQTSALVLGLKKPLFERIQAKFTSDPTRLASGIWTISTLMDRLAQHTLTTYQKSREAVIERQQQELLELSTPVVDIWNLRGGGVQG